MLRSLVVLALLVVPAAASAQEVIEGALPEPTVIAAIDPAPIAVAPTREELRAQLAAARATHLAELQRYVDAGVFPINDVQVGYLNVFQDPSGNLCAVANLMAFDGDHEMVARAAASTNYVRLALVHEGELYDWILRSGFTQEEIGRIQEPYFYQEMQLGIEQRQRQLDRERNRLQRALNRTIARLQRDEERSLDRAVDRLMRSVAASASTHSRA